MFLFIPMKDMQARTNCNIHP